MSWLARSLVNSLRPDLGDGDGDGDGNDEETSARRNDDLSHRVEEEDDGEDQQSGTPRGVKEDLSELTQTLTRQFWGVASFLAPPPAQPPSSPPGTDSSASDHGRTSGASDDAAASSESPRLAGIRSDFAEIGGRFRSGISMLSSNKAVSEISKIATTLFASDEGDEDDDEGEDEDEEKANVDAVGVTDEVLLFVRNVSMHPETWLDFPLLPDDDDSDDFYLSDAQQEHALAVERLAPRLSALRIELCPSHMTESCFWKIYFVLLHPRLNKHDAELLSTSQIVQARAMLHDLQNRGRPNSQRSSSNVSPLEVTTSVPPRENVTSPTNIPDETTPPKTQKVEEPTTSVPLPETETDNHSIQTEVKIVDKSVIKESAVQAKNKNIDIYASKVSTQTNEEDVDEWLEEDTHETGASGGTTVPLGNDEDVSFSDLEEDDDEGVLDSSKIKSHAIRSPTKGESGWVQLNKSSEGAVRSGSSSSPQTRESNDWLDVDIDAV